jgi:hypothetical protein
MRSSTCLPDPAITAWPHDRADTTGHSDCPARPSDPRTRRRVLRRFAVAALMVLVSSGCGKLTDQTNRSPQPSNVAESAWPSPADYTTIRVARQVMLNALLRQTDWRRRSYGASLAMRTLLTVRLAPGRCATYVGRLYGELWSLLDGYAGEDWRPLIRLVRRDPTVRQACQLPPQRALRATA